MKCEKCNNNEATFYYKSTINGKTTERHLCADCAREEGFGNALDWNRDDWFDGMFDHMFGAMDDFFGHSFFPSFGRSLLSPMLTLPRLHVTLEQPEEKQQETEAPAPKAEADAQLTRKRELKALKHQLQEAVKAEDFEKAIQLRDKLKELEQ